MSTLSNITPTGGNDTLPNEQDTATTGGTASGLIGLFEALIAKAAAPPTNESTPLKQQNQPPQATVPNTPKLSAFAGPGQKLKSELNAAEEMIDFSQAQSGTTTTAKAAAKAAAKSASGSASAEKNSQSQTGVPTVNVSSIELLAEQMLAAAFPGVNPQVKPEVSSAASRGGTTIKTSAIPAIPAQANQGVTAGTSTAATKISAADLSENQTAPGISVLSASAAQQASSFAATEAKESAQTSGITIPADPAATSSSKDQFSFEQDNAPSKGSDPGISTAAQLQAISSGTSNAKQSMAMEQAEKTNKFAGQTEKVLPGNVLSATQTSTSFAPSDSGQAATTAASAVAADNTNGISALSANSIAAPVAGDVRTRTLERTQEMVTVNATRLSDSGNNSMQVVIKPDAGTQLSLELRQQGSHVEVQAVLQQGDFGHLNQQWSDLQQRLEQRGIKLAPLTDDGSAFANSSSGGESFQNQQSQTNEGIPQITLVDAPVGITPTSVFAPEAKQTPAHQGWETWA